MGLNAIFSIQLFILVQSCVLFVVNVECVDLEKVFKEHGMEYEPISIIPRKVLGVIDNRNGTVNAADLLTTDQFEYPLIVTWNFEADYFYTYIFIDYDNKPNPKLLSLIANIPSNDIGRGRVLVKYIRPQPEEMEAHRCVLAVYRQNFKKADFEDTRNSGNGFDMEDFADQNNLGTPVAASFFWAYNDGTRNRSVTKST